MRLHAVNPMSERVKREIGETIEKQGMTVGDNGVVYVHTGLSGCTVDVSVEVTETND